MTIRLRLDEVMADRGIGLGELAQRVGITNANMSHIKTGCVKAIRFSTLDAICEVLKCQPGDILEYVAGDDEAELGDEQADGAEAKAESKEGPEAVSEAKTKEKAKTASEGREQ